MAVPVTLINAVLPKRTPSGRPERSVPLGILCLAAYLEGRGLAVEVRDYQKHAVQSPLDVRTFAGFARTESPILGIGCYGQLLPLVIEGARLLKLERPELLVVLGGAGPSPVASSILRAFPQIDVVVEGEGEQALARLADAHLRGRRPGGIPGLHRRENGCVVSHPPQALPPELIPVPAYSKIDVREYDCVHVQTSRGCPYRCAFCGVPASAGARYRVRPLDRVYEEIDLLEREHGVDRIYLADDTFTVDKQRVRAFAGEMAHAFGRLGWWCFGRINGLDRSLLGEMRQGGCDTIFLGVESGSAAVLKRIRKGFTPDQSLQTVATAAEHMTVETSFIWGFPFAGLDDLHLTLEHMERLLRVAPSLREYLCLLSAVPGSELHQQYGNQVIFDPEMVTFGQSEAEMPADMLRLIRRHPGVFPTFCHYAGRDFERKREIVSQCRGRYEELLAKMALDLGSRREVAATPWTDPPPRDDVVERLARAQASGVADALLRLRQGKEARHG